MNRFAPLAVLGLLAGCTLDVGNVFTQTGGAGGNPGGAGGVGGAAGAGGVGGEGASMTTGGTGGQPQGGSGGTGNVGNTGGSPPQGGDGGMPPMGGNGGMGGSPPVGPVVPCAGGICNAGEVCCWNYQNGNLDHCGQAGTCGAGYLQIDCNGPNDCPMGQVCCGNHNGQYYESITCEDACNSVTMCADAPQACMFGATCKQSQVLGDGYMVCTFN